VPAAAVASVVALLATGVPTPSRAADASKAAQVKSLAPTRTNQPATASTGTAGSAGTSSTAANTVPADVRARVVAKLHGATPNDVAPSPVPGLYEVTMGGLIAYVSEDGKYLLSGNVYDLDSQVNLTASRRNAARAKAIAAVSENQMIVFGPPNAKMTVTVFTDVDCGFCRKFHSQIADVNKAGVRVRYMLYPRTGPGTESWKKAEQVWCSTDRREALTRAKKGEPVKGKSCGDGAIKAQYELGGDLGVEGTPAVFTQNGDYIGGYLTPEELVQAVQDSQKPTVAAR
jgi:thiol:disulfide interchange protein DsbC